MPMMEVNEIVNACLCGREVPIEAKYMLVTTVSAVVYNGPNCHKLYDTLGDEAKALFDELRLLLDKEILSNEMFLATFFKWAQQVKDDATGRDSDDYDTTNDTA